MNSFTVYANVRINCRIGIPSEGVIYPVWGQVQAKRQAKKPDLRGECRGCESGDRDYTCIEFDIPDNQVLLSVFDSLLIRLSNGLFSDSEEEADQMDACYDSLPVEEQKTFKDKNWEQVFDITPSKDDWTRREVWVRTSFRELRKDKNRNVRFFRAGKH